MGGDSCLRGRQFESRNSYKIVYYVMCLKIVAKSLSTA